jgi:hypothetical protein|tara:strand:- start:39 stop:218 length:180 start_codon:yes stop_codon:yes gene_type:complete
MPKFEEVSVMDIWDKVCAQIERDVNDPLNDLQTLYLMLQHVPKDVLIAYLPESELDNAS